MNIDKKIDTAILALGTRIITDEIKIQTLKELLIEKEIITEEELDEKYQLVSTRDFDKLKIRLNDLLNKYGEE